ncbi:hypothetical protein [Marinivivus vitaminiproducens]|uniref:hypothetical protein n=1 Tax=Marinivivus vitaminiproducens TaxID=3035935 RepID=UPI0027AB5DD9|nr:hypothetical protein P4R82_19725 [Geminicoccaceae bacterium SCSIO 64248]
MARFVFPSALLHGTLAPLGDRPGYVPVCLGKLETGEPIRHKSAADSYDVPLAWDELWDVVPAAFVSEDTDD